VEEVGPWPAAPAQVELLVRERTRDGADVRVLATAEILADGPVPGREYVDPLDDLRERAEQRLAAAVRARAADELADRNGVRADLEHRRLDGAVGGRLVHLEIDAVELILSPPG